MEDGAQVIVHSAVRIPSPPPDRESSPISYHKRKRTSASPTSPPPRRRSPPRGQRPQHTLPDVDPQRALERERQLEARLAASANEPAKPAFDAKAEYEKLLTMRSGGTYIPPARLRALQAQITDKTSKEYQRMAWEALKKSINGLINKVNIANIKYIVPELFSENLIRGRGLYCRSIMKAQAVALPFTPIYAAITAIVNTKLPQVGELLVRRLVVQFRKAFKRNDKAVCISSTTFLAHLVNQQVVHETLAFEILMLLLMQNPTDDSVEIAVGFMREVGALLAEAATRANEAIFDAFRSILHESTIDKRVQYMIEVLFQVRRDKYKDNPIVKEELDLVEEEDQITHQISLSDDKLEVMEGLNVFKFDDHYEEHEDLYKRTKAEILGEVSGSEDEDGSDESESEDEDDEKEKQLQIQDQSNTNLVNLRRTIYLTIMSSIDFEECCHKLMKINLPVGQETELCSMIIECCSQERTYSKFYGLIGERFCKLNRLWQDLFEGTFTTYYDTIHRYETNRLRNIARFFGHQLSSDAVGWQVLSSVHMNEEETTSSSRIFVKILFQDLAEIMGMKKVVERLADPFLQESFQGLFPRDNPRNTRFAINYFTSIGMGAVTEGLREFLASMPKPAPPAALPMPTADSDSESVSSWSSYSSRSRSRSRSYSSSRSRSRSRSKARSAASPPPAASRRRGRRSRSRSYSVSRSRSRSRSYSSSGDSRSKSPYSRRSYSYTPSRSRSPAARRPQDKSRPQLQSGRKAKSRSPPPATAAVATSRKATAAKINDKPRTRGRSPSTSSSRSYSSSRSRSGSSRSRSRSQSRTRTRRRSPEKRRRSVSSSSPVHKRNGGRRVRSRSRSRSSSESSGVGGDRMDYERGGGNGERGSRVDRGKGKGKAVEDADGERRDEGRTRGRARAADYL